MKHIAYCEMTCKILNMRAEITADFEEINKEICAAAFHSLPTRL